MYINKNMINKNICDFMENINFSNVYLVIIFYFCFSFCYFEEGFFYYEV